MIIEIRKWMIKLGIWIFVILLLWDQYIKFIGGSKNDQRAGNLGASISLLLGVQPYLDDIKKETIKGHDVLGLSDEEWEKPSCKPMYRHLGNGKYEPDGRAIAPLKECIMLHGSSCHGEPYCDIHSKDKCLFIFIYEHVVHEEKIFNKIIEILSRPCDNLPTAESLEAKGVDDFIWHAETVREDMDCHKPEGKRKPHYTIITILDHEHKVMPYKIVVHRKD